MLKGKVTDGDTQEPLPGVIVLVWVNGFTGAYTDDDGAFSIQLRAIPDSVRFTYIGYDTVMITDLQARWPKGESVFLLNQSLKERFNDEWWEPPVILYDYIRQMDRIRTEQLQRGDRSSVEQALNLVPGIKFESRGPGGSRRLAIRGGFLRSPFGVRDVKAYLDDAPLTSPDGSTPLELIDAAAIGNIIVHKGPCASEYGAVSNGVVRFLAADAPRVGNTGGQLSQTIGAYGLRRTAAQVGWQEGLSLTYVRQRYAGYRAQEANQKDFLQLNARKQFHSHLLSGSLILYQGDWELPGSLDSAQVAADPRQALAISEDLDAHVARRHLRGTVGLDANPSSSINWRSAAYLHIADKVNPFGTSPFNQGYKVENSEGFGGRSIFKKSNSKVQWRLGGEYQGEWIDFLQYDNLLGQPGGLNTRSRTFSTQAHGFAEFNHHRNHKTTIAQVSLNKVAYTQRDAWSSQTLIPNGKSQLPPALAGSLQWAYHNTSAYSRSLHLKAASGYSPPALAEMTDSLGQLRSHLRAEQGLNLEARFIGSFFGRSVHGEATAYHHTVLNTIVPQVVASGRSQFENRGRTTQMGIEAFLRRKWPANASTGREPQFVLTLNGALQYYIFNDYSLDGDVFDGKRIPGVPLYTANLQGDAYLKTGTQGQATLQVVGKTYLDNANTVFQPTYPLVQIRIAQRLQYKKVVPVQAAKTTVAEWLPFAGVSNLLNVQYTNFPQMNAVAGRYWNPAPGISWFAGVDFRF